jgi:hypothetical protein
LQLLEKFCCQTRDIFLFSSQLHCVVQANIVCPAARRCRKENKQTINNKQHRRNQMKFNKWTLGLAAVGVVSLASVARADEKVSQLNTALSNTTISGYVDVGAQYINASGVPYATTGNPAAATPAGLASAPDSISLNMVDIALDKPLDATPFSAGYHIELWTGASNNQLGTGSIVRQAYLALGTTVGGQEIDWKIGVWDTIIGYEGLTSSANPNYTHSYGFALEPTTHTGIQGTYKINDEITIEGGIADDEGNDSAAINGAPPAGSAFPLSGPTILALVSLTAPDSFGPLKGATLSIGGTDNTTAGGAQNLYVGATIPTPLAALKFGAAYDYKDIMDTGGHVNVIGVYGTYTASDKLTFNARAEFADQSGGAATGAVLGFTSNYGEEFTATAQYSLWANVLSRVELRWDHADIASYTEGGNPLKNALFAGAELVYTF